MDKNHIPRISHPHAGLLTLAVTPTLLDPESNAEGIEAMRCRIDETEVLALKGLLSEALRGLNFFLNWLERRLLYGTSEEGIHRKELRSNQTPFSHETLGTSEEGIHKGLKKLGVR
nr:hypothetical protein Iba_chr11aCG9410 [Ipomoea batatas]